MANTLKKANQCLDFDKLQYRILFVDDDPKVLASLARLFRKESYQILTAESAAKAWQIIKKQPVQVLITDYRMPGISGLELLKKIKLVYPDTIRIMLTGYPDIKAVMAAVNQGAVYKFITKPWIDEDLVVAVRLAIAQYKLVTENKQLKQSRNEQVKNIDKLNRFINQSHLADRLLEKGILKKRDWLRARQEQVKTGKTMPEILYSMGFAREGGILEFMKKELDIQTVAPGSLSVRGDLSAILPKEICKSNCLIPVEKKGNRLTVVMADPTDTMKVDAVKFMTGLAVTPLAGPVAEIRYKIEETYREKEPEIPVPDALNLIEAGEGTIVDLDEDPDRPDLPDLFSSPQPPSTVQVVNAVMADALEKEASDVHIEVKSRFVMVRYRLSGLLSDVIHIPLKFHQAMVSRIKVMAGLDIAERRRPQDGRITVRVASRLVDMRLSTLPTIAGEKIVLRILDRNASVKDIEELGMLDHQILLINRIIRKPQGCLLVTGPTGSGKTSTLYSLINKTASIEQNYTTIEDPVEYYMEKAEQVMIKEKIGLTFPVVLKTLLRQDPDTIMLGEIRDFETAEVAFHAALTGHTVLSTLHTNSCMATITRLMDMGIEPHIISSALNGIVAQRLVRRICPHCMVDDDVSRETREMLGLDPGRDLPAKKGEGCDRCSHTGYLGRTGLYEILNINNELEMMLQRRATEGELQKAAIAAGMTLLIHSGIEKIKMGVTTCQEVLRVLGPQNLQQFICPSCSTSMPEQYRFCPFCAAAIRPFCSNCSRDLSRNWKACPDCGQRTDPR